MLSSSLTYIYSSIWPYDFLTSLEPDKTWPGSPFSVADLEISKSLPGPTKNSGEAL